MSSQTIEDKKVARALERRARRARYAAAMAFFALAGLIGADLGHPMAALLVQAALGLVLLVALAVAAA